MPMSLKSKVSAHLNKRLAENIHFFQNRPWSFILCIARKLSLETYKSKEIIYKLGDPAYDIYFIDKGRIFLKSKNAVIFRSLSQGAYFGEIELLDRKLRNHHAVVSSNDTSLFLLRKVDF